MIPRFSRSDSLHCPSLVCDRVPCGWPYLQQRLSAIVTARRWTNIAESLVTQMRAAPPMSRHVTVADAAVLTPASATGAGSPEGDAARAAESGNFR